MNSKFVTLLLAGAAMLSACSGKKDAVKKTPPATVENGVAESALATVRLTPDAERRLGLETTKIERRAIAKTRAFAGIVSPAPGASAQITAPFAGIVAAPEGGLPPPGSRVEAGAPILLLRGVAVPTGGASPADETRLRKLELDNAHARLKRTEALVAAEGASEEELELARADVARVEAAFNSLNAFGAPSSRTTPGFALRAPSAGILGDYAVGIGEIVSAGAPLFSVANLDAIVVRAPMFAEDAAAIRPNAIAQVTPLSGVAGVEAKRIEGPRTANALTGSVDVYFSVEKAAAQFRPGERVTVAAPVASEAERLVIPHSAIWTDIHGGSWIYEKTAEGVYSRRRVVIDFLSGDDAALVEGPPAGSQIVTVGVAELAGSEFGVGK